MTRASQINGCAFCLHHHTLDARKYGESEERLYLLSAWRESSLYSDRERAALGWTEALTLVAETHAPDDAYEALPPGTPIDLVKRDEWPQEYIQAAGEDGRRLTAELRQRDEAGGYEQFVIGRSETNSEAPTETISWSGGSSAVTPSEVLTTDEVVDLFVAYYHTGTAPPAFSRRPLAAKRRNALFYFI